MDNTEDGEKQICEKTQNVSGYVLLKTKGDNCGMNVCDRLCKLDIRY